MSISPYTLNNLYQNGILDFVPMDLCTPIVGNTIQLNPYLNEAMQGNMYKQYGNSADTFTPSYAAAPVPAARIGSQSSIGIKSMFGFDGTGSQSDAGISMYGETGIGGQTNADVASSFGGFRDVSNGIHSTMTKISNTPTPVKGLIAGGLIILTMLGLFKGKKAPKTTSTGSRWNPLNWFKKPAPATQPAPAKTGIWSKIKKFFNK